MAKKTKIDALGVLRGAFKLRERRELKVPGVPDVVFYAKPMTAAHDEQIGTMARLLVEEGEVPSFTDTAICTIIVMAEDAEGRAVFDATAAQALRNEVDVQVIYSLYNGITAQPTEGSVKKPSSEAEASSD